MLPLNSVFFVSKITDCSTRISSDQLTHAMSWWLLLPSILDALTVMQTQKYCPVVFYTATILLHQNCSS